MRFLQWKFYLFQFDVFPFLLFSPFCSFLLSLNSCSFFIVFFFIAADFFPKLLNFFYRRRFFDFDGLFSHLPIEFFRISLKYFILPVEFRPFSNLLILCALTWTFCFILSFVIVIPFSFCNLYFLLTFRPFLVFTLIPFDKSSSIDSSPLKASVSFWILRFQVGYLWLILFLFSFSYHIFP